MADTVAEPSIDVKDTALSDRGSDKRKKADVQDERRFVLSMIKDPDDPVLDVGTGDCACVAAVLARQGMRVVASDNDHETIVDARLCLGALGIKRRVRLLQDDISASALASNSFQNIVCFYVLHHVPRFDKALAELNRILAPDGRLIIYEYDENGDGFLEKLERAVSKRFRNIAVYRRPKGRLLLSCEKSLEGRSKIEDHLFI